MVVSKEFEHLVSVDEKKKKKICKYELKKKKKATVRTHRF